MSDTLFSGMPEYLRQERAARDGSAQDSGRFYSSYLAQAEWATLGLDTTPSAGLTLEAGCGTGRFLRRLIADGRNVIGMELSGESLRVIRGSREMANTPLAQAELTALPFRSGMFERIYCIQAFQSFLDLRDAVSALRELGRVLRDGGTLLLTTWNYQLSDRLKGARVRRHSEGLNFRKFEYHEMKVLLKEAFPDGEIAVWTSVHFHRKPLKFGTRLFASGGPWLLRVDRLLEKTPASRYLGHLVCARVHVRSRTGNNAN